jgi:Spy/CpxP family protein refolding chaperone
MKAFRGSIAVALVACGGGFVLAQDAPIARPARPRVAAPGGLNPMFASLALTDAQKQQVQNIFDEARQASRSIRESLRQIHDSVDAAIQAGKPASEVEQMAKAEGPLQAQLAGIDAVARAKFYASLTPDQQQKYMALRKRGPGGPGGPGGPRPMGHPGPPPPPPPQN